MNQETSNVPSGAAVACSALLDRIIQRLEPRIADLGDSKAAWDIKMLIRVARYEKRQLEMCDKMLTKSGVPEWVEKSGESAPGNSTPCRLEWYLARRKDIAPYEIDQQLQRDLAV